jgi:hypothetical protein
MIPIPEISMAEHDIDLEVDLNTMDETGLPWAFVDAATRRDIIRAGAHIIVGSGRVRAVAVVVDIVDDIVHVQPLQGSVARNRHLIDDERRAS